MTPQRLARQLLGVGTGGLDICGTELRIFVNRFLNGIGNVDGRLIIMLNLEEIIGATGDGK